MHPSPLRPLLAVLSLFAVFAHAAPGQPVPIKWLGDTPAPLTTGVSFGVPWPRGEVPKTQAFTLITADNHTLPVQTWPLAYRPDGSLKRVGVATVAGPETTGELKLLPVATTTVALGGPAVTVRRSDTTFLIDTGRVRAVIPMHGDHIIDLLTVDGRDVARGGRLASYVYYKTKNEAFLQAGVNALRRTGRCAGRNRPLQRVEGPEALNPIDEGFAGTNGASQSGLETIAMLGLVGDKLPAEFPKFTPEEEAAMSSRRRGNNPPPAKQP